MMTWRKVVFGVGLAALQAGVAAEVEFSAQTYQKSPQGVEQQGSIYVGKNRMRTETAPGPQQVVQILDRQVGKQWLLFPAKQSYSETSVPPKAQGQSNADTSPCDAVPGSHCQHLGDEDLSGRQVSKWKMTVNRQGQAEVITQWIDKSRGIPLRSEMAAGQRMEMRMLGPDNLAGRSLEKWEMLMWGADQPNPQRSYQWYDPQLDLVIREELPGGFLRELKNIKVGPQPAGLFQLPVGWQQVQGPAALRPGN